MFVAKILLVCAAVALVSGNPQGFGAPRELSGDDLEESRATLESSLTKLAAGTGPYYRVSRILSASTQVVTGTLNRYKVELIDTNKETKVCDVEIWSRNWLPNGVEVTFDCPNEAKEVRNHSA
ncbi:hypothetical protein AWZ03_012455 [Drosophila navojoa]|uniref:Cystatin domain-containing protein n=1 Tax=Drosophila navojoa TaxID=7232 RepID=A0A484AXJ6_DRONA|nr:sarcocystatin-A-like [Drosophila navojoa]TDG41128.1 hypothetical protein AWZ03_012455 [Drosophila navojoa]